MSTAENDTRQTRLFERHIGPYDIAGAIHSYGDVIDFVETGNRGGVVLVDTCGHELSSGVAMTKFLQDRIAAGWGVTSDARDELQNLGTRLASMRPPGAASLRRDEWHEFASGLYLAFDNSYITFFGAGGIGETLFSYADGRLDALRMNGGTLDNGAWDKRPEAYKTALDPHDLILICTDGLEDNTLKYRVNESNREKSFDSRIAQYRKDLRALLNRVRHGSALSIRNHLLTTFPEALPREPRDDDTTFVIIKRR